MYEGSVGCVYEGCGMGVDGCTRGVGWVCTREV